MTPPTRRSLLGSLGSGVAVLLAGCPDTLEYHSTTLTISGTTEIRGGPDDWTVDGSVSMQFGHEFDVERIEDVRVELYGEGIDLREEQDGADGEATEGGTPESDGNGAPEPLATVEIGTMTDPEPDEAGSDAETSFEVTVSQYPRRIIAALPEADLDRLCGSARSNLEVSGYELADDSAVGKTGPIDDLESWDYVDHECEQSEETDADGDPNSTRSNETSGASTANSSRMRVGRAAGSRAPTANGEPEPHE